MILTIKCIIKAQTMTFKLHILTYPVCKINNQENCTYILNPYIYVHIRYTSNKGTIKHSIKKLLLNLHHLFSVYSYIYDKHSTSFFFSIIFIPLHLRGFLKMKGIDQRARVNHHIEVVTLYGYIKSCWSSVLPKPGSIQN